MSVSRGEHKENERNYFWEGEQETFWREKERGIQIFWWFHQEQTQQPSGTSRYGVRGFPQHFQYATKQTFTCTDNHVYTVPSYVALLSVAFVMCLFLVQQPPWVRAFSFTRFLDHTQRHTTVGRTPLDESSARRRDLYLTTHDTHDRHPCPRWDSNPQSQQSSGRRPTP